MLRRPLLWVTVVSIGCSDSAGPDEPIDLRTVPAALSIVGGMGQADTISATLSDPIRVELVTEADATPVPGVIVNFVVVEPSCGRAFAGSALTDSLGRAADRWELGTKAGVCTMEVRAVDADGTPRVFASTTSTIRPGAPDSVAFDASAVTRFLGESVDTAGLARAWDRARNTAAPALAVGAPNGLRSTIERSDTITLSAGGRSAKKPVMWLSDLRRSSWQLEIACRNSGASRDSLVTSLTTDSLVYTAGNRLTVWGHGEGYIYLRGGSVVGGPFTAESYGATQEPGRLVWTAGPAATGEGSPPTSYTGGWCRGLGFSDEIRPATFRAR